MLKQAENVQYTYRELVIEQHLDSIRVLRPLESASCLGVRRIEVGRVGDPSLLRHECPSEVAHLHFTGEGFAEVHQIVVWGCLAVYETAGVI